MKRIRSLFLADIHLGTRACQAERLLAFMKEYDSGYLYLVGDEARGILARSAQHHCAKSAAHGAPRHRGFFIPGNHDEAMREYIGMSFGAVDTVADHVRVTANGQRLWIMHGELIKLSKAHQ